MKKKSPLLFICIFFFLSCSKDDDTKEYYFEANLNGEHWNDNNVTSEMIFDKGESLFILRSIKAINEHTNKHFLILMEDPDTTKDYNVSLQYIQGGDVLASIYTAEETNTSENSLKITEFDEEKNIMAGEFRAQLLHSRGAPWNEEESYHIEGKFRLPVQN